MTHTFSNSGGNTPLLPPILSMENISKHFGPVQALSGVSFRVRQGTLHALCGENGAGKSTLMKILAGVHTPDGGGILLNGKKVIFSNPKDALESGISMLYQELDLAEDLCVYENIFLGRELRKSVFGLLDDREMIRIVKDLFDRHGFRIDPCAKIADLSMGECQIVELAKALLRNAKIIVMDEPTSSLSAGESRTLFRIIQDLKAKGISIIYISHRLEEVMLLADEISVLRDGKSVFHAEKEKTTLDEIVHHMVGRDLTDFYPARSVAVGDVLFRAENLSSDKVHNISFSVRKGEILGMAGLVGAGRSECADAIAGIDPVREGTLFLNGKPLQIRTPQDAIREGIAYVTEDRKRNGLFLGLPCSWNMSTANLEKMGMKHRIRQARENALCLETGKKVNAKWGSVLDNADTLSGGNQQKLLIGRTLIADADFLIFDEPTRGIDIGAKKEVYTLLNYFAAQGKAILVISSELPELLGICDRILVMRQSAIAGILTKEEADSEKIMRLAASSSNIG